MRVRKSFSRMPQPERVAFLAALLRMKNTIANPLEPDTSKHISIYDQFVLIHNAVDARIQLGGATAVDPAHQGSAFGPWHREFLLRFELELQRFDPNVMLPYWDWTDGPGNMNIIFNEFGMGPDGDPLDFDQIKLGYFASEKPSTGANTTPLPAWYPATMNGWQCDPRLVINSTYNNLRRNLFPFSNLATQSLVRTTLNTPTAPPATDALTYMSFRSQLEAGPRMHNDTHNWFGVGSHMRNPRQSPNDPMFFLHHCNCDRLWAMWQMDGHEGNSFYQVSGGFQGHNLAQPMWPWIGGLGGYIASYVTGSLVIPDYSGETPRTAADVIDHRDIMLNGVNVGFAYDTQVVVGVALDRSGSMTGPTPDPLTGMPPNITKWEAAKQGIGRFLQDAEAAYQAAESYVVGGVNTFRSSGGTNEVLPVASATPKYGMIKTGSPYAQAAFNSDIVGVTAQGGTPLAAALSETEDDLVRPPFNDKPDAEQRYLCILTDGIETSPPLLSTLGTPEFADTIIFGLGFGIGSGWNGVDYGTIATLVSKGKGAPTGVQQTFHGENANVINKFFTNSIAHTLGFDPATDPRYEIFPGEMVMTPFEVTCGDQAFMVTVQGFDFDDTHWTFHLMGPDNMMHMKSVETPYLITMVRRDARLTIFLNRNYGPAKGWEGTWNVMVTYMPKSKDEYMYMASEWELLIHAGAPPLLGPRYTRFNQPAAKRLPVRLMQPKPNGRHPHASAFNTGDPATVAVNIYSKGHLSGGVETHVQKPYAGNAIELVVRLNDLAQGTVKSMRVTGRLIAPNFSLGNILLDFKTIPKSKRKKYYQRENDEGTLNVLNYLADYEKAKPGAFDLRDESLEFWQDDDGTWRAMIKNTPFPGSYQIGIQIEGAVVRADGCVERVWRVLNTDVALGIQPTVDKTQPTLAWVAPDRFVVRFTAVDKLGNIAVPSSAGAVQLMYRRQPIEFVRNEREDGAFELEIAADGEGAKVDSSGQWFDGPVTFKTPCGRPIELKAGTPLKFSVRIGSTVLPVTNPILEPDRKREK